ncbi:MAG TPA: hypothetical protein VIU11_02730 [Nakamurella sp.]
MQRKNVLIVGGIAAALLAIGGVAFAAGKGSTTETQTPTVSTVTVTATDPPPAPKTVTVTASPVTAPPVTVIEPAPPPVTLTVTEPAQPPVTVTEQAPPASGGSSGGGSDTSLSDATECNADAMALAETDPEASIRKSAECLRILGY